MRHAFARTSVGLFLLGALAASVAPGCGGGGGGGGGGGCQPPGTLAAIALEGDVAPDTGGGVYGFIPTNAPIAVAEGGFAAFVASFILPSGSTPGLFVSPPGFPTRLVYQVGEAVPGPGTGTIAAFDRIWVTPQGIVVALVVIASGGPTFGVLTARVDGSGSVVEKSAAVYSGAALPAATAMPPPGALLAIPPTLVEVSDTGMVFFVGQGAVASGVFRVDRFGGSFVAVAQEGQPAVGFPLEFLGNGWQELGIDEDGLLVGYAVNVSPSGAEGVWANNLSTASLVGRDGDAPPGAGARTIVEAYAEGPLVVALLSGVGVFVWEARLSGIEPNDAVLLRQVSPSLGSMQTMAAGGQLAPGGGSLATLGELRVLDPQIDALAVTARAQVVGGVTTEIFYNLPAAGTFLEVWRQGDDAPGSGVGAFTTDYPSLSLAFNAEADVLGSTAVSAVLSDATTGVFWALQDCGFFRIAYQGDGAPGTAGTFGSFATPSTVVTANGGIAFRAGIDGVVGTSSGIFRRF
jgi:hypothetical protein